MSYKCFRIILRKVTPHTYTNQYLKTSIFFCTSPFIGNRAEETLYAPRHPVLTSPTIQAVRKSWRHNTPPQSPRSPFLWHLCPSMAIPKNEDYPLLSTFLTPSYILKTGQPALTHSPKQHHPSKQWGSKQQ